MEYRTEIYITPGWNEPDHQDEIPVIVEYEAWPGYAATRDEPGTDTTVEVTGVRLANKSDHELQSALDYILKTANFEHLEQRLIEDAEANKPAPRKSYAQIESMYGGYLDA